MRLVDVDAAKKTVHEEFDECLVLDESGEHIANAVEEILEAVLTVDAVPVIRCKDCKHWDGYYCHHKGYGNGYANYSPPIKSGEGFCDWAERREK